MSENFCTFVPILCRYFQYIISSTLKNKALSHFPDSNRGYHGRGTYDLRLYFLT